MNDDVSMDLKTCMNHLAYVFERLGITEATFSGGKFDFTHNGAPLDTGLMDNLCQHILSIQKDELTTGNEDFSEAYFH